MLVKTYSIVLPFNYLSTMAESYSRDNVGKVEDQYSAKKAADGEM